jgi:hypothetical protein
MTTNTRVRDRLYFQQQHALLNASYKAFRDAGDLAKELLQRLDELDELDEGLTFEMTGGGITHRYSGSPVPWMQQRLGEHVRAVATAAQRLRVAAEDLEQSATDAGGHPRLAHIGRGYMALALEARRVVDSYRPDRELEQLNWMRVYAVTDGINRLEELHYAELRGELETDLADHYKMLVSLRASGLGKLTDRVDRDSRLQRLLGTMREYVGVDLGADRS